MKKERIFEGCATALITPFLNGGIDYKALSSLIDIQISSGIGCLVIAGTTGEAATLGESERIELYSFARRKTMGRCKLILGTGACDTARAVRYTRLAEEVCADGAMVVTPYYNKGTREGIFYHFEKIAGECDIPIIAYNVPTRTGVDLPLGVAERLARLDGIRGIKEASDSQDKLVSLASLGEDLPLYAGNDSAILTVAALGGAGAVSVMSNAIPHTAACLWDTWRAGEYDKARLLQYRLLPFIRALFSDTSPAPIKYLIYTRGLCSPEMRLPLCIPGEDVCRAVLRELETLIAEGYGT
jgi:4-hydroxy-tetrahydrodipicolinate synthase